MYKPQIAHAKDVYIYIHKPHKVPYKEHIAINPISQKPLISFFELTVSPLYMAKSSSISLFFILVLVCSTPAFEARKVLSLKKGEVSSTEESLDLATLPKGPTPHSSSSDDEGHAVVNINGRLFTPYLSSNNDSMPQGSVPSPGVGHTP